MPIPKIASNNKGFALALIITIIFLGLMGIFLLIKSPLFGILSYLSTPQSYYGYNKHYNHPAPEPNIFEHWHNASSCPYSVNNLPKDTKPLTCYVSQTGEDIDKITNTRDLKDLSIRVYVKPYLEKMPMEINQFRSLENLDLLNVTIIDFTKEMNTLRNLRVEKDQCKISGIQNLPSLVTLETNCQLDPGEVAQLKNLTLLSLTENKVNLNELLSPNLTNIESVYPFYSISDLKVLLNFKKLKNLELTSNKEKRLSPDIGKLTSLERLSLIGIEGVQIPDEIKNLSSLTYLDLGDTILSKSERKRIIKLLPKTNINFQTHYY